MKKIFLILLFSSQLFAQSELLTLFDGVSLDADAKSYIARMSTTPTEAQQIRISNLFKAFKEASVYAKILDFGILAGHDSVNSLLSCKNTTSPSCVGGITFTQYQGFKGDGISGYINTGLNLNTEGGSIYTQNSGSIGLYSRTNVSEAKVDFGVRNSGTTVRIQLLLRTGTSGALNGINYATDLIDTISSSAGFFIVSRTASNRTDNYVNGVWSGYSTAASFTIPAFDIYIGARNLSGTADTYATKEYAFWFIGGGLNQTEITSIVNAVEAYMDALGKGVIP